MNLVTAPPLSGKRSRQLFEELRFALSRADSNKLRDWGGRSASRLLSLTLRRVGGLFSFISMLGRGAWNELSLMLRAAGQDDFGRHFGDRAATAIDSSISMGREGAQAVSAISRALISDPKETAPKVLASFLGFYAGSGGVDGNGGIPDLDLLAGIDAHRSVFTHSIIAGAVAEAALVAIADLTTQIHELLPVDHDPLWDALAKTFTPLTQSIAAGTSAGIAYHLLIDAFIQPAPYHDLPFSIPIEGHQALTGANSFAEGLNAGRKSGQRGPETVADSGPLYKSTGRVVVDRVSSVISSARSASVSTFSFLKNQWQNKKERQN